MKKYLVLLIVAVVTMAAPNLKAESCTATPTLETVQHRSHKHGIFRRHKHDHDCKYGHGRRDERKDGKDCKGEGYGRGRGQNQK